MKICMFVYNNCRRDTRVLKEARTLAANGHQVDIIAVLDNTCPRVELRNGFRIVRVPKDPVHYRILRAAKNFSLPSLAAITKPIDRLSPFMARACCLFTKAARRLIFPARIACQADPAAWLRGLKLMMPALAASRPLLRTTGQSFPLLRRLKLLARKVRPAFGWPFRFILLWSRSWSRQIRTWHSRFTRLSASIRQACQWLITKQSRSRQACQGWIRSRLAANLKAVLMPFHRPLCFLDYYLRCLRLPDTASAQVYHAHDLNTLPAAWLASRRNNGHLVYDSHELYTETSTLNRISRWAYWLLERLLIRRADRVITVNRSIARILKQRYRIALPVVVMNCPPSNGQVPGPANLIRNKLGIDGRLPIILYQGGYSPNRGLENLVASMGLMRKGILVFMGWGPLEEKLRRIVAGLGLEERVFFIEPVPPGQLLAWTSSADLGVIPFRRVGLNNYYATPNKLFEYINAGVPVAASNFPEMRRIIEQFSLGRTFDPDSPAQIAATMEQILAEPDMHAAMRRNALRAARIYNWEHEGCKLVKVYRKLENSAST